MKLLSTVLGFFLLVALVLPVQAQDDYYEEARDLLEVTGYGGLLVPGGGLKDWNDSLGMKTAWQVGLEVGYFLTPELVLGFGFTYAQSSIDSPGDINTQNHRFYNPTAYLKYYFWGESDLAPYVKGMLGLYNPKFSTPVTDADGTNLRFRELSYDPAISIGGSAGLFYYTSDYSGVFIEAAYQYGFTEDAKKKFQSIDYKFGEASAFFDLRAGIRVFFGTDE